MVCRHCTDDFEIDVQGSFARERETHSIVSGDWLGAWRRVTDKLGARIEKPVGIVYQSRVLKEQFFKLRLIVHVMLRKVGAC